MNDKMPATDVVGGSAAKGRMLPGVAAIAMFLLFFTLLNAFAATQNIYGTGRAKYGALTLCTMLVAGLFGLLRMRRWGFSIVLAGCLLLSVGFLFYFSRTHQARMLVWGLFMLVFFFYLVRPEVRDRMV
jgi:hypothetical protein